MFSTHYFEILIFAIKCLDELYTLCGRAEMRQPIDFAELERNVADMEDVLKHHLIYNIHGFKDTKGTLSIIKRNLYSNFPHNLELIRCPINSSL